MCVPQKNFFSQFFFIFFKLSDLHRKDPVTYKLEQFQNCGKYRVSYHIFSPFILFNSYVNLTLFFSLFPIFDCFSFFLYLSFFFLLLFSFFLFLKQGGPLSLYLSKLRGMSKCLPARGVYLGRGIVNMCRVLYTGGRGIPPSKALFPLDFVF